MTTEYIDAFQFRQFIHDPSDNDSPIIDQVILSASRAVDKDCGRNFSPDATATAHKFAADSPFCCELTDWEFYTTTGLIVQTDTNGDGTYDATWTIDTDFILEPVNQTRYGFSGWPYNEIRSTGLRQFPVPSLRQPYPVQVTAKWGWESVPDGIVYATLLMANGMYKRGDAPFGVAGFDAFGAVRVRSDPQYLAAISPFIDPRRLVA